MRLIDADKLLVDAIESKQFVFGYEDMLNQDVIFQTVYKDLAEFINSQPTAYDIDKVVKQLEEKVKEINDFCSVTYEGDVFVDARREALLEAIEIVKSGGAE